MIYIMDYGLAKKYRNSITGEHIPFKKGKGITGTVRYSSINAQKGNELSRRDDLEGLSYILIYFLNGGLPWSGIKAANKKEKYEKILNVKQMYDLD